LIIIGTSEIVQEVRVGIEHIIHRFLRSESLFIKFEGASSSLFTIVNAGSCFLIKVLGKDAKWVGKLYEPVTEIALASKKIERLTAKVDKLCSSASLLMGLTSSSSFASILWMASLTKSTFARPQDSCAFGETLADRYLTACGQPPVVRSPTPRKIAETGRSWRRAILAVEFMV
jgi:hypothetical protein